MHIIQAIVGLGNPGEQYTHTRHNAGAWFIELLLNGTTCMAAYRSTLQGHHAVLHTAQDVAAHLSPLHLLTPSTYMNHSGSAVLALLNYYKIPAANLLVVHDDLDLPVGTIKLKWDGGDGGHNGVSNIIALLHTKQFYRLRVGIGRPLAPKKPVNYVLEKPSRVEREQIDDVLIRASHIVSLLRAGHIAKAMQQLHQAP